MIERNSSGGRDSEAPVEDQSTAESQARAKLAQLIAECGIEPLTLEDLRAMSGVWPEDESVDDFLQAREQWRGESRPRELP